MSESGQQTRAPEGAPSRPKGPSRCGPDVARPPSPAQRPKRRTHGPELPMAVPFAQISGKLPDGGPPRLKPGDDGAGERLGTLLANPVPRAERLGFRSSPTMLVREARTGRGAAGDTAGQNPGRSLHGFAEREPASRVLGRLHPPPRLPDGHGHEGAEFDAIDDVHLPPRRLAALALAAGFRRCAAAAEAKTDFKICWSIYVGWMPWGYIQDSGIMKKWAEQIRHHRRDRSDQRLRRIHQPVHRRRL